jgi:hypothetical protein
LPSWRWSATVARRADGRWSRFRQPNSGYFTGP